MANRKPSRGGAQPSRNPKTNSSGVMWAERLQVVDIRRAYKEAIRPTETPRRFVPKRVQTTPLERAISDEGRFLTSRFNGWTMAAVIADGGVDGVKWLTWCLEKDEGKLPPKVANKARMLLAQWARS